MTKKPPNLAALTNELQGASLFFTPPSPAPKSAAPSQAQDTQAQTEQFAPRMVYQQAEAKNVQSSVRTDERSDVQKPRRIIRHAFDIYADQLYALQTIQLKAVQNGRKKPKLGTMVQRALDLYLKQKKAVK
jgi:hypothetical protein